MKKFILLTIIGLAVLTLGACSSGGGSGGAATLPGGGGGGGGTNSAPVFTSTPPTSAVEGAKYSYQATATDANGDPLSWGLITAPAGMIVSASGLVEWSPIASQVGSHSVQLDVSDGQVSTSQNWTITVTAAGGGNQPPVITSSPPTTATEAQLYSYQAAGSDPNGDPLTWSLSTKPTGMTVNSSSGLVQWTPSTAQVGNHSVTLEVSDGTVSASQSWTITVSAAGGGGSGTATGGSGGGTGNVTGSYQGRNYSLYVPSSYSQSTPVPLVIALHGAGDTWTSFHSQLGSNGWTSTASSNNFILMTPQHLNTSRPSFLHLTGTGALDAQATSDEIVGVINAAYYGAGATHNIDTEKIYLIGFSEGAVVTDLAAFWYSEILRAVAPYAGGATGKPLPVARDIPVYGICGTSDSGYSGAQAALAEWTSGGHSTKGSWPSGIGHSFAGLCASQSPSSVYSWLSTASFTTPVKSAYTSGGGGGGGGGGTGGSNPTGGSGGAAPGNQTRNVTVSGLGSFDYYLYIPSSYTPGTPLPIMFAFHGAGGTGTSPAAAQAARNDWATVANTENFIVVAQASTGSGGGWLAGNDSAILNAIITDVFGAYNIEQNRIYAWGFSAGGHFIHALALQNANFFAAYGVNAGVLAALAGTSAPAAAARKIPVDIHIGTSDSLLTYAQQDKATFQSAGWTLGTNLHYTEFSGGHTYTTTHLSQIWNNLKNHVLP